MYAVPPANVDDRAKGGWICRTLWSYSPGSVEGALRKGRGFVKSLSKQCFPTPRTGPTCATPGASLTKRSMGDAGAVLLSAREMHGGKVPDDAARARPMVSDKFWVVACGFPRNWISGALRLALDEG